LLLRSTAFVLETNGNLWKRGQKEKEGAIGASFSGGDCEKKSYTKLKHSRPKKIYGQIKGEARRRSGRNSSYLGKGCFTRIHPVESVKKKQTKAKVKVSNVALSATFVISIVFDDTPPHSSRSSSVPN